MKKLPKSLYRLFWDTEPEKINVINNARYVMDRVLEWGRPEDLVKIKKLYGVEGIKNTVKESREISVKSANYYALIYSIPKEEIRCLSPEFREKQRRYWKR